MAETENWGDTGVPGTLPPPPPGYCGYVINGNTQRLIKEVQTLLGIAMVTKLCCNTETLILGYTVRKLSGG